jgi:pimeloyl-ACP methyl ester carboxylesterase
MVQANTTNSASYANFPNGVGNDAIDTAGFTYGLQGEAWWYSADRSKFSEASRVHYAALYALPGAMHAGFAQFAAFDQDAIDNRAFLAKGKLKMPVLAIGGEKSFGPTMAVVMRAAATNVTEKVIAGSGHWLMEEQPEATVAVVRAFLGPAK